MNSTGRKRRRKIRKVIFSAYEMSLSDVDSDVEENEKYHSFSRKRSNSETRLADIAADLYLSRSCVFLLSHPSVFNFCRLRKKLKSDDQWWMEDFLKREGLELLFDCLEDLGRYPGNFSNLVLRIECVLCIRTVMNSGLGLRCLIALNCGPKFASGKLL